MISAHDRRRVDRPAQGSTARLGKKTIVANLQINRKWVEQQPDRRPGESGARQAENIMVGCIQTCRQCQHPIGPWIDRNDHRKRFRRVQRTYATVRGKKALVGLIDVTREAVQAATWIQDFWVGALPTPKEPRQVTQAELAALERGRRTQAEQRRERKRRLE